MIGYLKGRVVHKDDWEVILECGGVGYELTATTMAIRNLPDTGGQGELFVHFSAGENGTSLFGFASLQERQLFRLLLSVSSVGPKGAIALLSSLGVDALIQNIATGNSIPLTKAKGVGKKIAERVVLELKERITDIWSVPTPASTPGAPAQTPANSAVRDALDALVQLGYRRPDAAEVLAAVPRYTELDSENLIREALRRLR